MYIVLMPSMSAHSGSGDKTVAKFKTKGELLHFILTTTRDIKRLEIFEVTQLDVELDLVEKN